MIPIYRDVKRRQKDMINKIKSVLNVSLLILSITINTNILSYYKTIYLYIKIKTLFLFFFIQLMTFSFLVPIAGDR
jgi:hypothetical protein